VTSKPTVAHLIRCYLSPTETFIFNQISSLRKFRPIVLCHRQNNNQPFPFEDAFCSTKLLPKFYKISAEISYRLLRHLTNKESEELIKIIKSEDVKLLHFHYLVDARYFLKLSKATQLPKVVSCYGYDVSSFPKLYLGYGIKYLKPIFQEMDIFLAMSEDMKKDLIRLGCPKEKILVHYHGIKTEKFAYPGRTYADKETVNILSCGTLEEKKAQHLVLKALKKLELEGNLKHKFHLTIVGDGPMRNQLRQMVCNFSWQKEVIFKGHIPYQGDRLVKEYHNADIFVLPSITSVQGEKEGIPGTVVEAMAAGLPIVSTYHAGIPSVIENYKEGILVKERDIKGLVHALQELIENRNLREKLGRAAAKRAIKEFDARARIKNLERIYESLTDYK